MQTMLARLATASDAVSRVKQVVSDLDLDLRALESHPEIHVVRDLWKGVITELADVVLAADQAIHSSLK